MRRKRKKSIWKMMGIIISIGLISCIGIHFLKKKMEIPFQKVFVRQEAFENRYYFHLLEDKEEQHIYEEIAQGLLDEEDEIYLPTVDVDLIHKLMQYVNNDFPEVFWCNGAGQIESYRKGFKKYSILLPDYQFEDALRKNAEKEIRGVVDEILKNAPMDGTDYEKIKYVYEYIVKNTEYDETSKDNQNIYSVLINGKSVCAGYARTTEYLLEQMGVECTYVTGQAKKPDSEQAIDHAWNLVKCEGDYYYVDTTWGDPIYLEDAEDEVLYDYLCISDEELFRTHTPDSHLQLPKCTATKYNYYVLHNLFHDSYDRKMFLEEMRCDIDAGEPQTIFKFSNPDMYHAAEEEIIHELVPKAAQYLGRVYGLPKVRYSYKAEELLDKITIIWKYE